MVLDWLVGLVVGLVVGGLGLFVAGQLVHGEQNDVEHAMWTAIIGALVWTVLAWVPVLWPFLLAPLGWLAVIRWPYPGSWAHAITVAVVAWGTAMAGLVVLRLLGLPAFGAIGIPLA